eukprot:6184996-Pleurochrysis_carterae.AAC.2
MRPAPQEWPRLLPRFNVRLEAAAAAARALLTEKQRAGALRQGKRNIEDGRSNGEGGLTKVRRSGKRTLPSEKARFSMSAYNDSMCKRKSPGAGRTSLRKLLAVRLCNARPRCHSCK